MPRWIRWTLAIAAIRIVAGIGVAIVRPLGSAAAAGPHFPLWIFLLQVADFGAAAVWLIAGSRSDPRSGLLGGFYLLIASAFSGALLRIGLAGTSLASQPIVDLVASLPLEAFLPALLWKFLDDFPRVDLYRGSAWIPARLAQLSAAAGAFLLVANLLLALGSALPSVVGTLLGRFARNASVSLFWAILFALIVPGLPFMVWKARLADRAERRRVRLFVFAFVLGAGPIFVQVLLENLVPPIAAAMSRPHARQIAGAFLYPALLTVPISTAYAVRVHRALDVRLVVRRAVQYLLARYTLAAATAAPFVAFAVYAYVEREHTIAGLLSGPAAQVAATLTLLGLLMLRARRPLLDALDRRFFREQHDAHRVLADLAESLRRAENLTRLSERLSEEIDRALHVESIAVLLVDPGGGRPDRGAPAGSPRAGWIAVHGTIRGLPATSVLGRLLAHGQPIEIDWSQPDAALRDLTAEERDWLVDGAFQLLVPIVSSEGHPLGLIALSEKRSELPFSSEDRLLLQSIATSVALVLESRYARGESERLRFLSAAKRPGDQPAVECERCGRLEAPNGKTCGRCGGTMSPSPLPLVLGDKFQLEGRVGAGGMGVVYRALDLSLHRTVALKTLPRPEPHETAGLRREARAMARVSHPNLALIYGAESWRGVPILILEFMQGGTLTQRLLGRSFEIPEVLELGIVLCDALRHLHEKGIIHRDIKPSNLGFTENGVPKLLDFGIARMMGASRPGRAGRPAHPPASLETSGPTQSGRPSDESVATLDDVAAGTLMYMSPEALAAEPAHPMFDLWGLTMVLYETIAGGHPFASIRPHAGPPVAVPDLRGPRPDCPERVAAFFNDALASDRARRPSSAVEMMARLEAIRGN